MERLMKISGKRVILNAQYSKIGFGYPRLFIEVNDAQYINFDISLGATFNMKKEDFNDLLSEAALIEDETEVRKYLAGAGVNYDKFAEALVNWN
jgi:hypothetical protein